ncbi:hypothetical protein M758_UG146400 [Ceratodon purpureus]|nr:hypothetical protein M758_UG146400 [Ceratodon purpureus]
MSSPDTLGTRQGTPAAVDTPTEAKLMRTDDRRSILNLLKMTCKEREALRRQDEQEELRREGVRGSRGSSAARKVEVGTRSAAGGSRRRSGKRGLGEGFQGTPLSRSPSGGVGYRARGAVLCTQGGHRQR